MSTAEFLRLGTDLCEKPDNGVLDSILDCVSTPEEFHEASIRQGYDISRDEAALFVRKLKEHAANGFGERELSDAEMAGVAGGIISVEGSLGDIFRGMEGTLKGYWNFFHDVFNINKST